MRVHELVDTFAAAGNPALTYGAAAAVAGGNLVLTLNSGGTGYARSVGMYDLTGSRLVVELVDVPVTVKSGTRILLNTGQMSAESLWWSIDAGVISAIRYIGQQQTTGWSAPFDPSTHRWVSIRHDPARGVVIWSTSSDGIDWLDRALLATTIPVTALQISLSSVLLTLSDPLLDDGLTPGPAKIGSLNVPPVPAADPATTIIADGNAPPLVVEVLPATGEEGSLVLDVSELDGPDLLGWGSGPTGWVNIVCDVHGVHIARGATNALGPIPRTEAGTCTLTITDRDRRFDPTVNADAINPRTPIRVRTYGEHDVLELVELRRNRVPNPRTLGSTSPYLGTNCSVTLVAGKVRASITTLGTTGPGAAFLHPTTGPADPTVEGARFPAVPGDRVAARVRVTNPNASAVTVRLDVARYAWSGSAYSSAGVHTGAWVTIAAAATSTLELVVTVPAGTTTHVLPIVYFAGATSAAAPASGTLYDLTAWALLTGDDAPTATPVPYFDGTTATVGEGADAISYAWAGTPDASAAVEFGRVWAVEPWSAVLFTGRINADGIVVDYPRTGSPTVTISASDLVGTLTRWESAGHPDGIGAGDDLLDRVRRVLTETGLGDSSLALDPDPTYVATLAATTLESGWQPIEAATEAELGRVWVTADNRLAVRSRGSELSGPTRGTLSDWHGETVGEDDIDVHCCYTAPRVSYSPGQLTNRAIGTRQGGTVVQVDDEFSQARYGLSAYRSTGLDLETDGQLEAWGTALLVGQTEPRVHVDTVSPTPWAAPAAWPAVALTDIGDRWYFRLHPEVGPTVRQAVGVLGITHDITPESWSTVWSTVQAPEVGENMTGWFTLDVSELDSTDLLVPFV